MRITCPICSTSIEVSQSHVGKKGRCTNCTSKFIIPEQDDAEFEILERGEIPGLDPVKEKPAGLRVPGAGTGKRSRARFRISNNDERNRNNPVLILSILLIVAALIVLFSPKEGGDPGNSLTAQETVKEEPLRPAPGQQQTAQPTQANTSPEWQTQEQPGENTPPPAVPEATTGEHEPVEKKTFTLSEEKQKRALAYMKSGQESKRKGAYLAMRNLGKEAKPVYLDLLAKARIHYLTRIGDIAFNLSVNENALTDFKESYENWQDMVASTRKTVQTDWKKIAPQDYRQRHQEMDDDFGEAVRLYLRTVKSAERAKRQDLSTLEAPLNILREIAGESAWCLDRETGKIAGLIDTVRNAGGAEGFVKIMNTLENTQALIQEREAVARHNMSCNWAGNEHIRFASLLNDRRVAINLDPLRLEENLSRACRDHSIDMATNGYFSHTGLTSETRTFTVRAKRAGFTGGASGECIFMGNPAAVAAHKAWWYSDGHRLIMYASGPGTLGLGTSGNHWTLNTAR